MRFSKFFCLIVLIIFIFAFFINSFVSADLVIDDELANYFDLGDNVVIIDDTVNKYSGADSLNITVSGGTGWFAHHFSISQDFGIYVNASFWWYGANSNADLMFELMNEAQSSYVRLIFSDNFTGWQQFNFPFTDFVNVGNYDLSDVRWITFESLDVSNNWGLDKIEFLEDVAPSPSPSPSPSPTLAPITSGELNNSMLFVLGFMVVMCVVGLVWLSRVPVVVLLVGLFAVLVGLYCVLGGVYGLGVAQGWFALFTVVFGGLTMLLTGLGVRVRR